MASAVFSTARISNLIDAKGGLQRGCPLVQQSVFPKDSKAYRIRQRQPAADIAAEQNGWRLRSSVKTGVIAALAMISVLGFGFFLFWGLIEHEPRQDISRADAIVVLT